MHSFSDLLVTATTGDQPLQRNAAYQCDLTGLECTGQTEKLCWGVVQCKFMQRHLEIREAEHILLRHSLEQSMIEQSKAYSTLSPSLHLLLAPNQTRHEVSVKNNLVEVIWDTDLRDNSESGYLGAISNTGKTSWRKCPSWTSACWDQVAFSSVLEQTPPSVLLLNKWQSNSSPNKYTRFLYCLFLSLVKILLIILTSPSHGIWWEEGECCQGTNQRVFFMLPWCCQLFSDQSESIVLCCQSFSADVQLPWRKTGHHHHLAIRKVYASDVNLKRSDPGPGPAHHPHLAIRKAWGWDVNLKRSDEDKARDGGAAVVSESVFRSVRIETRDKIEIFWYFPSRNIFFIILSRTVPIETLPRMQPKQTVFWQGSGR